MNSAKVELPLSTKITKIRRLSAEVIGISLHVPPELAWRPGQYIAVSDMVLGIRSYYSIANAYETTGSKDIELVMHEPSVKWPGALQVGSDLCLSHPGGGPEWDKLMTAHHLVLIGIGTGVAPLRAVAQAALNQRDRPIQSVTLVQGARDRGNCLFYDEFVALDGQVFKYMPVLSRSPDSENWKGRTGRVQAHFAELPVRNAHFFICGKLAMVSEASEVLGRFGASPEQIFSEGY